MSSSRPDCATALAARPPRGGVLVRCGAELVELSERFYRGLFAGGLVFVGLAAVAALAALPWRESTAAGGPPVTIVATALLAAATPVAVWRSAALYRVLRSQWTLELVVVAVSAALVAYPLRSQLWWPSCALIMLIAILAPLGRTLAYCLVVLLTNLAAHVWAGDLSDAPPVAILGLWVGYPFWSLTFSVISDRLAAYVLRLNTSTPDPASRPVRVGAWVTGDPPGPADHRPADPPDPAPPQPAAAPPAEAIDLHPGGAMSRLTARQLQVTALLVDGLRYREVAACLAISERQVQRHVANAITRAGVRTANELIAAAVAEGLAPQG